MGGTAGARWEEGAPPFLQVSPVGVPGGHTRQHDLPFTPELVAPEPTSPSARGQEGMALALCMFVLQVCDP